MRSGRRPLNNSAHKADTQAVRSKVSWASLAGWRNRLSYMTPMREGQPRRQLAGRLLWSLPVEGHHRGGHAWFPRQLGAPPVADWRHVNLVRTPAYGFFEVVNDHLSGGPTNQAGNVRLGPDTHQSVRSVGDSTRSSPRIKRREARRHRPQPGFAPIVARSCQRKICVLKLPTRFSRVIHRFSTAGLGAVNRITAGVGAVALRPVIW
jgi:hypothetical protein